MKRYGLYSLMGLSSSMKPDPEGDWVLYSEAQEEIARLREAIREYVKRNCDDDYTPAGHKAWQRAKDKLVEIAREGR